MIHDVHACQGLSGTNHSWIPGHRASLNNPRAIQFYFGPYTRRIEEGKNGRVHVPVSDTEQQKTSFKGLSRKGSIFIHRRRCLEIRRASGCCPQWCSPGPKPFKSLPCDPVTPLSGSSSSSSSFSGCHNNRSFSLKREKGLYWTSRTTILQGSVARTGSRVHS